MSERKIALIGSSGAREVTWKGNQIDTCTPSELLLALKAHGFTVVIITTRRTLSEVDLAWSHLADRIFLPIGEQDCCGVDDQSVIRAYQAMFKEFGFQEPIVNLEFPSTWLDYQRAAVDQGAVDSMSALRRRLSPSTELRA